MRDSSLRELPASALALGPAVKTLDAGNNRIAVLPPALGGLASLQRLVLTQNRLEAIGPVVQLSALKILLLDGNLLGSLPPALGQLTKLEKLSVSGNSLAALPAEIGSLRCARTASPPETPKAALALRRLAGRGRSLRTLCVSENKLAALPAALGDCTQLEELEAKRNAISDLPAELGAAPPPQPASGPQPSASWCIACRKIGCLMVHVSPR